MLVDAAKHPANAEKTPTARFSVRGRFGTIVERTGAAREGFPTPHCSPVRHAPFRHGFRQESTVNLVACGQPVPTADILWAAALAQHVPKDGATFMRDEIDSVAAGQSSDAPPSQHMDLQKRLVERNFGVGHNRGLLPSWSGFSCVVPRFAGAILSFKLGISCPGKRAISVGPDGGSRGRATGFEH